MMPGGALVYAVVFAIAAACLGSAAHAARGPVLVAPAMLAPDAVVQVTTLTSEEAMINHMQRPLDAGNTVIYDQQFGNSVAAGALLGPFGVVANIAATKRRTENETAAMQGKFGFDGAAMAREALAAAGFMVSSGSATPAAVVTPTIRVISSGGDTLYVSVMLSVAQTLPDGKPWRGTYAYYLDEYLQRPEVVAGLPDERRAALVAKVREGFMQAAALLRDDAAGILVNGRQIYFTSKTMSPRFDFQITGVELPASEGRVVVRTASSVASAPADRVEIVRYVEPKQ